MKIQYPSKKHLRSSNNPEPVNHLLGKELIIDNDSSKKVFDLTAIVYDPDEERKYPGNNGAYGINFVLTREQMAQLAKMVEEWKVQNNRFTEKKKINKLEKLIGLYQEKLIKKNELLDNYRKSIESMGITLPDFWAGKLHAKINELAELKKTKSQVIEAPPILKVDPTPKKQPPIKGPFIKDIPYKKPHQIWGNRDYNPPV